MGILETIKNPDDVKKLTPTQRELLCNELRTSILNIVSKTGGHLGANLGVVELTVALHTVFSAPVDKIVFDVSHQVYAHKLLTGRQDLMKNLRTEGGASGFARISESKYDSFGAGHASTAASAAYGMAIARDIKGEDNNVIAVIGDGAMSGGMTFEAINNMGNSKNQLTLILNDNGMSIAPAVGAISMHFAKLTSSPFLNKVRNLGIQIAKKLPDPTTDIIKKAEELIRNRGMGIGLLFEEMGLYYIGPIDGHDLPTLIEVLENIKTLPHKNPVLLHIVTKKGNGYKPAESLKDRGHGVAKFSVEDGFSKAPSSTKTYTSVFSKTIVELAKNDEKIVAITAAMPDGTGLTEFANLYPNRFFDVGIAEEHAVTFAAGIASQGLKPVIAVYSTFVQRAFDQIIHDVDIQNLPVRFMLDRAGYVGEDGATHCGAYDLVMFGSTQNFVVMAPSSSEELEAMVKLALSIDDRPTMIRYPRGEAKSEENKIESQKLEIGKGRIIKEGNEVAIISIGSRLEDSILAASELEKEHNINATVVDMRFLKPLDTNLLDSIAKNHKYIISVEEGIIGGLASSIMEHFVKSGYFNGKIKFYPLTMPKLHIEHMSANKQRELANIDKNAIVKTILDLKNN